MNASEYSKEELSSLMASCENEWLLMGSTVYSDIYLYNRAFKENYKRSLNLWFEEGELKIGPYRPDWVSEEDRRIDTNSFFENFKEKDIEVLRCTYSKYVVLFEQTLIMLNGVVVSDAKRGELPKVIPDSMYVETILTRDSDETILSYISGFKQASCKREYRYLLAIYDNGNLYNRIGGTLKFKDVDVDKNYNDDLPLDKINDILSKDEPGLVLFYGLPGGGKTTLIRHLMQTVDRKFIVMEPELIDSCSNGKLLDYLSSNSGSIIVLEDCEKLLMSREEGGNKTLGMLLNLTDGILGELFNIKFLCTFNCELKKIDKALLRKGRLSLKYEFKELCLEKTKQIYPEATEPMTLADAYFATEENDFSKEEKAKIGF